MRPCWEMIALFLAHFVLMSGDAFIATRWFFICHLSDSHFSLYTCPLIHNLLAKTVSYFRERLTMKLETYYETQYEWSKDHFKDYLYQHILHYIYILLTIIVCFNSYNNHKHLRRHGNISLLYPIKHLKLWHLNYYPNKPLTDICLNQEV